MQHVTGNLYSIGLGGVNAFVIDDSGLTLIDTGFKNRQEKIYAAIRKAGKNPDNIKQVILTHCHPDHAGSAAAVVGGKKIPVCAHTIDADLIEKGISHRRQLSVSPGIGNFLIYNLFIKPAPDKIEPVYVNERLKDGDLLPFAGGLEIIHTPGHSAGHIALLMKNEGILIAADICANNFGIGLSTIYEDRTLGIESALKVAAYNFDIAVFGHGKPLMQNANKKIQAKFLEIQAKEKKN